MYASTDDVTTAIHLCDEYVDHSGELYIIKRNTKRAVYFPCRTHKLEGNLYELREEHFKALNEKHN
jgi:hypothetical protein